MGRELNKVFDAKTREGKRRILDKFNISKEDKNEFLNKIDNSGGGIKWEYYKLDWDKINNLNLSDVKKAVSYSGITNCQAQQESPKFIDTSNIVDWETYRYSKIGGTNARIVFTGSVDEAPKFIIDNNSWIANIKVILNVESIPWLIPITEEEFFTFGDDSEYKTLYKTN